MQDVDLTSSSVNSSACRSIRTGSATVARTRSRAATPRLRPAAGSAPDVAGADHGEDALDLGATVLPVLARTYWKHAVVVLALVVLVVWLLAG